LDQSDDTIIISGQTSSEPTEAEEQARTGATSVLKPPTQRAKPTNLMINLRRAERRA
jgi:hypothetical protein